MTAFGQTQWSSNNAYDSLVPPHYTLLHQGRQQVTFNVHDAVGSIRRTAQYLLREDLLDT